MQKHVSIFIFALVASAWLLAGCTQNQPTHPAPGEAIIANPLNLNYRFQFPDNDPSRREAADPVCEYFKGKYYLFASKSGGYWSSPDLVDWTYIPSQSIATIENYAPTIWVIGDTVYYMGSWEPDKIYKTANPGVDNWELIDSKFQFIAPGTQDPAFFRDDDGRVYAYWGCSNQDPIFGVEVDPNDGFQVISEAVALIQHKSAEYGWEASGHNNDRNTDGWNEGPCMIKHNGKYYLQYAGPGTEFRVYGDGIYIGDTPLGPFTYMENSPFTFKPGGFIGGAGHGHTFQDKYGNYWHVASMKISQRHMFERRLGIFPVFFSDDNKLYSHCEWTDYPFRIPDKKINLETEDLSVGWNLLSYGKQATASSSLSGYSPEKAADEQVESWWAAETGNPGEWLQIDLAKPMTVNAIQVNFADQDFTNNAADSYIAYQYIIECSTNGDHWKTLIDRSENTKDAPHELIVLPKAKETRYLRLTNKKKMTGKFSVSDLRVFGNGNGALPQPVENFHISRDAQDSRIFHFTWDAQEPTTGYVLHWGVDENHLYNTAMVYGNEYVGRSFNRDSKYYFKIDAFNENGIIAGTQIYQ
ncbi:endo-1,4-beta-xylanase [Bacteroidia bacterium]|nr:endo-1,4-beta-xylanase [Bacteroidia bacterium]